MTLTEIPDGLGVTIDTITDVATVEMRRPPHNYFDAEFVTRLADTIEGFGDDVRAVVLCAEGRSFCGGVDYSSRGSTAAGRAATYRQAARLIRSRLPIVAAVQGAAVGGGLGLAMAADFRVATSTTRFIPRFADLGIHHGFGLSHTLLAAIGLQRTRQMLYGGVEVWGPEAVGFGLADRYEPNPSDLLASAQDWAARIAAQGPLAVIGIRDSLNVDAAHLDDTLESELAKQKFLMDTEDWAESGIARREYRPTRFIGR